MVVQRPPNPSVKVRFLVGPPNFMKLNEVNSNLIFLFPVVSAYLVSDIIYFYLSAAVLFASFYYHLYKNNYSSTDLRLKILRGMAMLVAVTAYFYMFYFVYNYVISFKPILYLSLFLTISLYFFGRIKKYKNYNTHSYFHLFIGLVAGVIPILS